MVFIWYFSVQPNNMKMLFLLKQIWLPDTELDWSDVNRYRYLKSDGWL